jgi:phytoene dehydrogenase-like protein
LKYFCFELAPRVLPAAFGFLDLNCCYLTLPSATYLHSCLQSRQRATDATPLRIGIIGAGVAGLRCADILLHYGFAVTILEGRNRLGGRLHQERLPNGHLVDVGPNWIHGTNNNPIMNLVTLTQTPTVSWDGQMCVFDEHGQLFPAKDGDQCFEIMWDIILAAFKHSEKYSASIDPEENLLDFFQAKVPEFVPETVDDHKRKREVVLQMAELWGAFVGSPITRQSLKFFWLEECLEGGTFALCLLSTPPSPLPALPRS